MKTKLLSMAVASLLCASVAEARFYIGIEGGYTGAANDFKEHKVDGSKNAYFLIPGTDSIKYAFKDLVVGGGDTIQPFRGFNVGLNLGTEHLFANNYVGIRWGASVGYTNLSQKMIIEQRSTEQIHDVSYLDAGLNLDLIINFWSNKSSSIGIFGGVGADYHFILTGKETIKTDGTSPSRDFIPTLPSRHSLDLSGRVGLTTMFASHHRIDITAKLPIGYVIAGNANKAYLIQSPVKTSINVGYKYIF